MTKEEYYLTSDNLGLPRRCPILNICQRRAWSIYLLGYYDTKLIEKDVEQFLVGNETLGLDYLANKTEMQGEMPSIISGSNNIYFHDVCPEVNLFDKMHGIFFVKGVACIEGDWDKFREKEEVRILECRHFSDCPEFAKYSYENKYKKKIEKFEMSDQIKNLLIEDKIYDALEVMKKHFREKKVSDKEDVCIVLMRRFKELQDKELKEIENTNTISMEKNKLVHSILSLLAE